MKAVAALYLAQAREFLRDRSTLLFVLLLPVAFGVFFGLVFAGATNFFMPGMLGVALLWLGVFGVAQPAVAQRAAGILRRWSLTPITRTTMLTAEVGWRVTVGLLQALIFVAVGYFGFGVGVQSWLPFFGAVLLGTLLFCSLGYVIAGLSRSAEAANAIGQLINFPMMMLSGSIFSADLLPAAFRPVLNIMPLTYLSDLLRQTMAGTPPLYSMQLDFTVLAAWFLVLLALSARLWRWE